MKGRRPRRILNSRRNGTTNFVPGKREEVRWTERLNLGLLEVSVYVGKGLFRCTPLGV